MGRILIAIFWDQIWCWLHQCGEQYWILAPQKAHHWYCLSKRPAVWVSVYGQQSHWSGKRELRIDPKFGSPWFYRFHPTYFPNHVRCRAHLAPDSDNVKILPRLNTNTQHTLRVSWRALRLCMNLYLTQPLAKSSNLWKMALAKPCEPCYTVAMANYSGQYASFRNTIRCLEGNHR